MGKLRTRGKMLIASIVLIVGTNVLPVSSSWTGSANAQTARIDASVCFTPAEADSLLLMFDDMYLQIRLLEIDLEECTRLTDVDQSSWLPNWMPSWLESPWVWFTVGITTGMVVSR